MQTIGLWERRSPQKLVWYYDTDWKVVLATARRAVELVCLGAWWYHSNKAICLLDALRMILFALFGVFSMITLSFKKSEPSTNVEGRLGRPFGIPDIAFIVLALPSIAIAPSALLASMIGRRFFPSRARTINQVLSCFSCLFFRVASFYFQARFVLSYLGSGNGPEFSVDLKQNISRASANSQMTTAEP
ncbi:hypothetical protein M378DRAFT_162667, partial [Amanita muscaria Koide BX008]